MPRFARNFIKTSYLHIMTQGINKTYIFEYEEDIKYYIKIMYELLKEYKIKIIAYCIMNNHTHMLVKVEKIEEISNYMLRLNSKYARYYNKKYKRVGYVFRDRFRSEGIYNDSQLYNCMRYIYNNPVKAGICNRPDEYKWSYYKPIPEETSENLSEETSENLPEETSETYIFIDDEEEVEKAYKEYIKIFMKKNDMDFKNLKKNKELLKELITTLNKDYGLSLRKIAVELNIPRETLRLINKK